MVHCAICGRELTYEESVRRGIGPDCWEGMLQDTARRRTKQTRVCDYILEFLEAEKICIIKERVDPKNPKISLTNCIDFVLQEVVQGYELCPKEWAFVQYANSGNLFGGYHEYDLIDNRGHGVLWRYLWHSDAKGESHHFSNTLLAQRVARYRAGARAVIE